MKKRMYNLLRRGGMTFIIYSLVIMLPLFIYSIYKRMSLLYAGEDAHLVVQDKQIVQKTGSEPGRYHDYWQLVFREEGSKDSYEQIVSHSAYESAVVGDVVEAKVFRSESKSIESFLVPEYMSGWPGDIIFALFCFAPGAVGVSMVIMARRSNANAETA